MSQTDPRQTLLAINSTEWLNLCARGSIRMSKRRPTIVSNPASEREMEKVFACTSTEAAFRALLLAVKSPAEAFRYFVDLVYFTASTSSNNCISSLRVY